MISAKPMASSTPGMANARSCIMLPITPFESAVGRGQMIIGWVGGIRTLLDHLLEGTCGVDFHGVEVLEAVDLRRVLRELLAERV